MDQSIIFKHRSDNTKAVSRVHEAISALSQGRGVLLMDDENRENEADVIFAAETLTVAQMALLIRDCSGIVCLCLTAAQVDQLALPPMVERNNSQYGTAFTVSIEATKGVTTGVSAADRVTTIKAAVAQHAKPQDLARPGHVYPLKAHKNGVFGRTGHTEGTVDLMQLAELNPAGVLCELMNPDGSMAKGKQVLAYSEQQQMPLLSIEDIRQYRKALVGKASYINYSN
ncbi:3,4-dihydroxy-2-butanone-4-phosphate synthase [Parashewanella spongiae]|uniref:3,4-dihydroxy-2-butanone 4-phosphate synthase n=1 Tax=Parashewanella spongiae TaxID=342950 RepID=A0A3A6U237_9GAMM|nr:3,4-dihydroxy-2-butanone-4-phosphate synthase [Parashewanella spongiae]MCL1079854.1 3,4-dihydroxy-2-butanone-4-phosphate synthase [Parashewanella spongiae]RJY06764.1 3,4-dihydroxy-2-butanone-4-phosphate synthase [Parashewanella spongiae]